MITATYEKKNVRRLTVKMPSKVDDYALVFLRMFNNAREYPETIMQLENNSGSEVFITCPTDSVKAVRDWVESFVDTEVVDVEEVDRFIFNIHPNKEEFVKLFGYDNESQYVLEVE